MKSGFAFVDVVCQGVGSDGGAEVGWALVVSTRLHDN